MDGGRQSIDQASVQQDHVAVTITPPALNASNIASSSAPGEIQTLNSSREGVPTANVISTSGAADTLDRSLTPDQPTSSNPQRPWRNPCSWRIFDFYSTSIQIILLLVFLWVFRDEHPDMALQVWAIGYGSGCVAMLALLYCTYMYERLFREAQSDRLPLEDIFTVAPGTQELADELETTRRHRQRFEKILEGLWRTLVGFFIVWFCIGLLVVETHWATGQAPRLNGLCAGFLVFSCFRFISTRTIDSLVRCWCPTLVQQASVIRERTQGASANDISALRTYTFHARETTDQASNNHDDDDDDDNNDDNNNDEVRVSIGEEETRVGGDDVDDECSICLDLYEEGVELKELPCIHHFHVECIDRWLTINGSCPICKKEVAPIARENGEGRRVQHRRYNWFYTR